MNRTLKSKIKYIFTVIIIFIITLLIGIQLPKNFFKYYLIIIFIIFSIPRIIQLHYYKTFFKGRKLLSQKKYRESILYFNDFLSQIELNPWKKKLIWLSSIIYSNDIEAMTFNNIGSAYLNNSQFDNAEKYFFLALKKDDLYAIPFYNLSLLASMKKDLSIAEKYFLKAKKLGFTLTSFDKSIQLSGKLY